MNVAGLFYNVHRWYENGTGRYTEVDPATSALPSPESLLQPYLYADGSPTRYTDSLGLYTVDPSCDKWCGPPTIAQCSLEPAGQCIAPLIEDIRRRLVQDGPCRRALENAGKWREARGALHPNATYPIISCHSNECVGPNSSVGRYHEALRTIPLCSNYFVGRWEPGAQTMFHEILHDIGVPHGPIDDAILTACYPGYVP